MLPIARQVGDYRPRRSGRFPFLSLPRNLPRFPVDACSIVRGKSVGWLSEGIVNLGLLPDNISNTASEKLALQWLGTHR